jgi:amino acid adenylation domain-containing protein
MTGYGPSVESAEPNTLSWNTCPAGADISPEREDTADVLADFDAVVELLPGGPAIVHNGAVTTYRELAEDVRSASARYRGRRSDSDQRGLIGTVVSHTPAAAVQLLGALHAGAMYCPIDVAVPQARRRALAEMLGLNELYFAITNLEGPAAPEKPSAVAVPSELAPARSQPSDPAYVLCTSGSTGMPKPVVVSRRALTATVRELRRLFGLTSQDRVLQFASLGWDTCLEEIMPALTAGATLIFDDAAFRGSFSTFIRMLADREITMLDLPTAFWHELVLFLLDEGATLPDCVRLVVIGGERVDPTRLRQWRDIDAGHVRLLNTYGCTETTMVTHAVQLCGPGTESDVAGQDGEAPIGRALAHLRDHVTDEGELWISGPSLATGYLGLPDLTAAAFPVVDQGSGSTRWFPTGDLVTRGANGLLYCRGRLDEQVKVLGVRVHPAEVEMQLNTHWAVAGAVVVGEPQLGRTVLRAYVVAAGPVTSAELKQHLRERLPAQFVPSSVKFVAALKYTASGKVDRAATRRAAAGHDNNGGVR